MKTQTAATAKAHDMGYAYGVQDLPAFAPSEMTADEARAFERGYERGLAEYRREEAELSSRDYHRAIDRRAGETAYYDDLFTEINEAELAAAGIHPTAYPF